MIARKTRRTAAGSRVARSPDDRAVIGCAITALAALLLMLLAGTAKAEQPDLVCWKLESGALECESRASIAAACAAIGGEDELCLAARNSSSNAPHYFPGNTKYTAVTLTRAGRETWSRNKRHLTIKP
jgi:hypothetical protein